MSKHNKNYTRYSKMNREEAAPVNEVETEVIAEVNDVDEESASNEVIPEVESVQEPVAEPEPTVEPTICKYGRIHGCKKLNVRKMPNPNAEVLIEIVEGAKILIDEKKSTAVFYKVCTECGIEGYCMKQYIKVLP